MIDLQQIQPPIAFAAANCEKVAVSPNGIEEYWRADIKAVRHGILNQVFKDVLFVEKPGEVAFLAGIEHPDGIDRGIHVDLAEKQAEFIAFLREENEKDSSALGVLSSVFVGSEYATIAKATAAYMAVRELTHSFGVGFFNQNNEYQHLGIILGEESGFDRNMYLPFDELGE